MNRRLRPSERPRPNAGPGIALVLLLAAGAGFASGPTLRGSAQPHPAPAARRALPLLFRAAGNGMYAARGPGYLLRLAAGGARLGFGAPEGAPPQSQTLAMRLVNGNPRAQAAPACPVATAGEERVGTDPHRWRRHRTAYRRLRYASVYPGIDLQYRDHGGRLEYDFLVAPHADPRRIGLAFDAPAHLRDGSLILGGACPLRQLPPVAYQMTAQGRRTVACRYVLRPAASGSQVAFELGAYDARLPLVIDPLFAQTFVFTTGPAESPRDITTSGTALDPQGNIYVCGNTPSTVSGQGPDVYIAKLDPSGTRLLYETVIGGSGSDTCFDVAVDAQGDAWIGARTDSADLQPTPDAFQTRGVRTGVDGVVAKLDAQGVPVYVTYLGGFDTDRCNAVAVDPAGNAYVTGITFSFDFPLRNPVQEHIGGAIGTNGGDAFVVKFTPQAQVVYSTFLGGRGGDFGVGIAADAAGSAYVVGNTGSPDFPVANALQPASRDFGAGVQDAFVTKLSPDGSSRVYSTYLGGTGVDFGYSVAVDSHGAAIVCGSTDSADFFRGNGMQPRLRGGADGYVVKLDPSGRRLLYATYLGGSGFDAVTRVRVDAAGFAYLGGATTSLNFPLVRPIDSVTVLAMDPTLSEGFLAKLDPTGARLVYSTYLGRLDFGFPIGLAVRSDGTVIYSKAGVGRGIIDPRTAFGALGARLSLVRDGPPSLLLQATPAGVNFGRVAAGATPATTLRVRNVSRQPFHGRIGLAPGAFELVENGRALDLVPGAAVSLHLRLKPHAPSGEQFADFGVFTGTPAELVIVVPVHATVP
jgi:hypothetical protein